MLSQATPAPGIMMKKTISRNEKDTCRFGQEFARQLASGTVVALYGEMGSGKTTFVRGVSRGLGCRQQISSPTFTLINEYEAEIPIYHFDFYRISHLREAWELGYEDYFNKKGICLIEWPERVLELLPPRRIDVYFEHMFEMNDPNARAISVKR